MLQMGKRFGAVVLTTIVIGMLVSCDSEMDWEGRVLGGVPASIGLNQIQGTNVRVRRIGLFLEARYFNDTDLVRLFSALAADHQEPESLFVDAYSDRDEAAAAIREYLDSLGQPVESTNNSASFSSGPPSHRCLVAHYGRWRNGEEELRYTPQTGSEFRIVVMTPKPDL
jgi:hypothetical protein